MNVLNYGRGLLSELDDAATMHDDKLAANIRKELVRIEADVRATLAAVLDGPEPDAAAPAGFAPGELGRMRDRLDAALGIAPEGGTGRAARRNAAKPAAPEARPAG
ncbi:hypothetical protein KGQ19_18215 [Catenulispora sp. NL8]|uniref:Uncharacterized protein n=1 Tax=Catenulispora pinistramenti TaxID=2705254 RepID=A0ABS5KS17_9ACTN|nr:hypothetical protein [Catenulispora pinistramenti]MBS2548804.1 hypothetical protein [Catenulispora pinistramenti]